MRNGFQTYNDSIPRRYYRWYSGPRYMNIQPDVGTRVSAGQYHVYSRDTENDTKSPDLRQENWPAKPSALGAAP